MTHTRLATLTIAFVLVTAACSGASSPTPATPGTAAPTAASSAAPSVQAGSAISIANFAFAPAAITVSVGGTVTWTNSDSAGHTVTADDGSFKSDTLVSGATFSQTFAKAGTFAYHCSIHSAMTGTVTVK